MRRNVKIFIGLLVLAVLFTGIIGMTALAASNNNDINEDSSTTSSREDKFDKEKWSKGRNQSVRIDVLSVAASVLEADKADIMNAIKDGKVGDLLVAADKVDEFKTAYLSEAETKLNAAVTAGTLTQEQADEKYAAEKEKMDNYDGTTHLCGNDCHSEMFSKDRNKMSERRTKTSSKTNTGEL